MNEVNDPRFTPQPAQKSFNINVLVFFYIFSMKTRGHNRKCVTLIALVWIMRERQQLVQPKTLTTLVSKIIFVSFTITACLLILSFSLSLLFAQAIIA
jgi:hypothetical protein